jgi:hypothetical protein
MFLAHKWLMITTGMKFDRRIALASLLAATLTPLRAQDASQQSPPFPPNGPPNPNKQPEDRLPNGKSQSIAMAKQEHEDALKDARNLVSVAQQLKDDLEKSSEFVVSTTSIKKTEEIEKLARRIRSRLNR